MIPILIAGPAVEPVTLPEMQAYLRLDGDAEAELVAGLIKAARLVVEAAAGRVLIEQRWRVVLDRWPDTRTIPLPLAPVIAIDRIRVQGAEGAVDLPPQAFAADLLGDPPRLRIAATAPEPVSAANGISIELRAGFGPDSAAVPATLRLALKILVARWFENRGDIAGDQAMPPEALALVAPFRRARL